MKPNTARVRIDRDTGRLWLTEERYRRPIRRVKDITDDVIFAFGAELTAIEGQDKVVSGFRMSDGVEIRITAELVEGQHADR